MIANVMMLSKTPRQRERTRPMQPMASSMTLALDRFSTHGLEDLHKAGLMERFDTKYLLPAHWLASLLLELHPFYSLLQIDAHKLSTYQTTYFDTPLFDFYHMHHNGKLNRYKMRRRRYVESNTHYLEVKFKNNKKRTHKDRVLLHTHHDRADDGQSVLMRTAGRAHSGLQPSLKCQYRRIALANEQAGERLTLDFDLCFEQPDRLGRTNLGHIVIAELKRANPKAPSHFAQLMQQRRRHPVSFSKYCIGCCYVHAGQIRTNCFKPTLRALQKMN